MRVYLIRHAQSENNVLTESTIHQRKVDPDLTALGYRQRDQLASFLMKRHGAVDAGIGITRLYTSAMYRSLLTTQAIVKSLNLQPKVWLDLHEKGGMFQRQNGHVNGFNGLSRSAILREFPEFALPEALTDTGWYNASLGMEPETYSYFRAIKVANELRELAQSDQVIALVSHGGFLDILLKAIFDQLPSRPHTMRYYHDNTAISRIDFQGSRPVLNYLNRVDHLPIELRSF